MFWKKRKQPYSALLLPFDKAVESLSKEEAQAYFDWYLGKIDERVDYLRRVTRLSLDFSPVSLVPLWAWFLRHAEIEKTPEERNTELRERLGNHDPLFAESIIAGNRCQLTTETEYMIQDIAKYFGQVFVKNHACVHWGYYTSPKWDESVNQPVIMGFPNQIYPQKPGVPLQPEHIVYIQATKLLRSSADKRDLYNIYSVWAEKLSK